MSWQDHLIKIPPLTLAETEIFAPPREMEAAIASYNRALANLRADSADIAQIALRKLVIQYPLFGPAGLLYATCMTEQKRFTAAAELINRSRLAGLRPMDSQLADALQQAIQSEQEQLAPTQGHVLSRAVSGSPILEKTRKSGKARMASRKEVLDVVRNGERSQTEETFVADEETPGQRLRRLVLIAGITLGLALVATICVLVVRAWTAPRADPGPDTEQRLDYLLNHLDDLAAKDPQIAQLLADYDQFVTPPAETETSSEVATTSQPATATTAADTVTPTPSETQPSQVLQPTGPTTPTDLLTQVYSEYQAALILAESDPVTAAENLLKMSQASASLDSELKSPAVPLTVADLHDEILAALDTYRVTAAEALRVQGSRAYDSKDYQTSLDFYLRAYALQPLYYGGGVAYYCGRNYQALGQNDQARPYYEQVVANFPGREIAGYAKTRLQEMGFASATTVTATAATTTPAETSTVP